MDGKKTKVVMVGQKGIPVTSGGIEKHVEEIGSRLAEGEYEVKVYNRSGYVKEKRELYRGVHIKTVSATNIRGVEPILYSFFASIRAVFSNQQIVHYHALGPSVMCFIPKMMGKKVVVTVHGLDWQRQKWGPFARYVLRLGEKMAVRHSDQMIVVGKKLVRYYKESYGKDTIYIPNGISSMITAKIDFLTKWNLSQGEYILFLARIVPEKGCHYLLEAYSKEPRSKKLVIAGGSGQTDYYYETLKNTYESKQIIFTGEVELNEVEQLYSNAYAYILPSDIEGMPISLLEAMSCAKCCLVSDIEENMDVIEKYGQYGLSFKAGDVEDLAEKLGWMIENPTELEVIGDRAKEYVLKEFNWKAVVQKLTEVYEEIV